MIECTAAVALAANAHLTELLQANDLPRGKIEIVCENDLDGIPVNFGANGKGHYGQAFITTAREIIVLADRLPEGEVMPTVEHELAHIVAWRKYGFNISSHGWQFKRTCKAIATASPVKTC